MSRDDRRLVVYAAMFLFSAMGMWGAKTPWHWDVMAACTLWFCGQMWWLHLTAKDGE